MPPDDELDNLDLDQIEVGDLTGDQNGESETQESDEAALEEGSDDETRKASEGEEGDERGGLKPASRGDRRIQKLAAELKERREKDELRDRELAELKARFQAPAAPDPELERQRLALMTPEDRMQHQLDMGLQQNRQMLAQMQAQQRDTQDRLTYEAAAVKDPRRAKLQAQVEQVYTEQLRQGRWVPRETVYFHELGRLVASQVAKKAPSVRKASEDRVRRQQAPLGSNRGDVSPERGRGSRSFEDKYSDVPI